MSYILIYLLGGLITTEIMLLGARKNNKEVGNLQYLVCFILWPYFVIKAWLLWPKL